MARWHINFCVINSKECENGSKTGRPRISRALIMSGAEGPEGPEGQWLKHENDSISRQSDHNMYIYICVCVYNQYVYIYVVSICKICWFSIVVKISIDILQLFEKNKNKKSCDSELDGHLIDGWTHGGSHESIVQWSIPPEDYQIEMHWPLESLEPKGC